MQAQHPYNEQPRRGPRIAKSFANAVFWIVVVTAGASLFGSPAGLLGEYWYWWPSHTKAEVVNSLATFGFGTIAVGGWAAINRPDRNSLGVALGLVALIAIGLGSGTVDCTYLFRCP